MLGYRCSLILDHAVGFLMIAPFPFQEVTSHFILSKDIRIGDISQNKLTAHFSGIFGWCDEKV